jgi:hypothetical protein
MTKTKSNAKGYILRTSGAVEEAPPKLDLDGMYKAIGCTTVQLITLAHGEMWMDEEGKLSAAPQDNNKATRLWVSKYGMTDVIVGNVYLRVKSGWVYDGADIVRAAP